MKKKEILNRQMESIKSAREKELREKFIELFGFSPVKTNIRNLRNRLLYKVQEIYYGGLSDYDKARLAQLATEDSLANLKNKPINHYPPGTRFKREWKGKVYEVIVLENSLYECEGVKYRSLSAVACQITGTHWNGRKFFGIQ